MKYGDEKINVAAVYRDGSVNVYGHVLDDGPGFRPYLYSKQFANYGQAMLWAAEYEDAQRSGK